MGTRSVAIDWEGLERALTRHSYESEIYLDTLTGDVVYVTRGWSDDHSFTDGELDEGLVSRRLLPIAPLPAETEHGWMTRFADSLEDGWPRDGLRKALSASHTTRRFEDALGYFPAERQQWLACRAELVRAVVRTWLVASEVAPATDPPKRLEGVLDGAMSSSWSGESRPREKEAGGPDPSPTPKQEPAVTVDRARHDGEGG